MQRFLIFLLIMLVSLGSFDNIKAIETNFPEVGEHLDANISPHTENMMGEMIMQKIYGSDYLIADPIVNEYLQSLADKFSKAANLSQFKLHFFGVNTPELNAFAFFGGHVAVHGGLILAVENESELAAVLAHETAHITQRHLARIISSQKKMMPVTFAEVIAALAIGAFGAPEAGIHLATAAMAGHVQRLINFTREHEYEADHIGMQLLSKTHYDPKAMANVFQRLKQRYQYQKMPPEYLLTHPIFDARIADAQNRAASLPRVANQNSLNFYLIRARLEALKEEPYSKKISRLKTGFDAKKPENKATTDYGYAIALLYNRKASEALPLLQGIVKENPDVWEFELALAEAEASNNQLSNAIERTKNLLLKNPNNYAIVLQLGSFLLKNNQPAEVIRLLKKYKRSHETDPELHQMFAKAYSLKKDLIMLHRSQAEYYYSKGEFKEAYQQLDLALEYSEKTQQFTHQIRLRKVAMQDIEEQQKDLRM